MRCNQKKAFEKFLQECIYCRCKLNLVSIFNDYLSFCEQQIRVRRVFDPVANNLIYTSFSTRLDKNSDTNKGRYKSSMCAVHLNL
jgi:catabolite regulation protein CreA